MSNRWPLQSECNAFYGNPRGRNGRSSPAWEAANLVAVKPPFKLTFAGKPCASIRVHRKCAESLGRVLAAINVAAGGDWRVLKRWGVSIYGGSYCFRLMRGLNSLSMHSYGCAIDFDPARNPLGRAGAFTADHPVVKAFEAEGWVWGGHWEGRPDPMHFQAARV